MEHTRNTVAGNLSGGNKRRLSVAIAIIGYPKIILLDEPTAGMDPESRQFVQQTISKLQHRGQSALILTTHSMEEAEALSTKMGIIVSGGELKCFGTAQHIKAKYSSGFIIEMKCR